MQKSLSEIQKENRKFILEAIHGCSYEEALKKELGFGCKVLVQHFVYIKESTEIIKLDESVGICDLTGLYVYTNYGQSKIIEIIGKPLTLSRVLLAFKNKEVKTCYGDEIIFNIAGSQFCGLSVEDEEIYATTYTVYGICLWNLALGEIEITLEEQSEETQRKINELFNN